MTAIDWQPLPYMQRASDFLYSLTAAGLPLEPGARKTSITLSAFTRLKAEGRAQKMLIVAPKRVCKLVWPPEIKKWKQFEHLRISVISGTVSQREKALRVDADVYAINPENVVWLVTYLNGKPWPFDVVTIDELTRFKDNLSKRAQALRPNMKFAKRRWGLTGSLTANGYIDVFGQQMMLDDGAALGRFVTRFRDQHFNADFNGFTYTLRPGADKIIAAKISPYWFDMDPSEYAQLPPMVDDPRMLPLDAAQRRMYDDFDKKSVMALEGVDDPIIAANSAALYNKLSQLANGAIYTRTQAEPEAYTVIHNVKLDALEDLIDELDGSPLLVAYEFKHDLYRMQARLKEKWGEDYVLPCFGGGYSDKQEEAWKDAWNRNELRVMATHPQSAGHGLNLQEGNANHIAWFGVTWSWELYDQLGRRLRRSGNEAKNIFNHLLLVPGTIDELKLTAVANKFKTHTEFLRLLTAFIKGEMTMSTQALPAGWVTPAKVNAAPPMQPMQQPPASQAPAAQAPAAQPPAQNMTQAPQGQDTQRQAIRESVAAFATVKPAETAQPVATLAQPAQPAAQVATQAETNAKPAAAARKSALANIAPATDKDTLIACTKMLSDAHLILARVIEALSKG